MRIDRIVEPWTAAGVQKAARDRHTLALGDKTRYQ